MLTISKPLSAGQAQTYHRKEFTAKERFMRSCMVEDSRKGSQRVNRVITQFLRKCLTNTPVRMAGHAYQIQPRAVFRREDEFEAVGHTR